MSNESNDVVVKQSGINTTTTTTKNTRRRKYLVALVVVGIVISMIVIIVPLLMSNGNQNEALSDIMSDLDLFRKEGNNDLNDTHTWSNTGNGLELTIMNALDVNWHEYFNTSVQQWDNGTPDSLTLSTEIMEPDTACSPMAGYLKVCNGNYGPTEWEGINHAFLDSRGKIYASTAQMNEYFLLESNTANRQYTMCHELGHGFGLSHTDENMYNINQGNCMDYTTRPWNSQTPNDRNFNTLSIMYGTVIGSDNNNLMTNNNNATSTSQQQQNRPSSSTYQPPSSVFDSDKQQQQQKQQKNENNDDEETKDDKNDRRHQRQRRLRHDNKKYVSSQRHLNHDNDDNNQIPDLVYRAWDVIQNQFIYNNMSSSKQHKRRHLSSLWNQKAIMKSNIISSITNHRHMNGNNIMETSYTFHIDNGHSIRIQFLSSLS